MPARILGWVPRIALAAAGMVLTLAVAGIAVFFMVPLAPGDPAYNAVHSRGVAHPSDAEVAAERVELGLDRPLLVQLGSWGASVVRGDVGESYRSREPVRSELAARLPATLLLAGTASCVALVFAVPIGLVSAAAPRAVLGRSLRAGTVLIAAVPAFLLGLLVINLVVLRFGIGSVLSDGTWRDVWLPAAVLGVSLVPQLSEVLRSGVAQQLDQRYVTVAASRGASPRRRLLAHAGPNALAPFAHSAGLQFGALVVGAFAVEVVFSWPGLGLYAVDAVRARDLPAVQGVVLLATAVQVIASALADGVGRWCSPAEALR